MVSEDRIAQIVLTMGKPADVRLTPAIAREVCERSGSAAVLEGSIAQIGSRYLLTLKALNCASGESLASTEAEANDKDHVLDALGKTASVMRRKLGESLSTVQRMDTPLDQATTPSFEALLAFTEGGKVLAKSGESAAIPFYKHAVELDPNFAMAYAYRHRTRTNRHRRSSATIHPKWAAGPTLDRSILRVIRPSSSAPIGFPVYHGPTQ